MSGSAASLIEEGLPRLEFVGIVHEHGETSELIFARSAAVICAGGTFSHEAPQARKIFSATRVLHPEGVEKVTAQAVTPEVWMAERVGFEPDRSL